MPDRGALAELGTTHRGFDIRYSENEDVWRCYDIDVDGATLSAVKRKIDRHIAESRKAERMPAIEIPHSSFFGEEVVEVLVTAIADKRRLSSKDKVWVTPASKRRRRDKDRYQIEIGSLAPETPEARTLIVVWRTAVAALRRAEKAEERAKAAIPRLRPSDLRMASTVDLDAPDAEESHTGKGTLALK